MLDRLDFLIGEALVAMRRNGLMAVAATMTVAMSLFLLGGFGYAYYQIKRYADALPGRFDMRVYLVEGAPYEQITATAQALREIPGVKSVNWIPKEKAWEQFSQEKGLDPNFVKDLGNPLPDGYKVILTDLGLAKEVVAKIQARPEVDSVQYLQAEQEILRQAMGLLRWLGLVLGGLLFGIGGILIYNAIRLTVVSRRLEIRIMRLVGSSGTTIQIPFLIEGVVQGALGGVLASGLLYACDLLVGHAVESSFMLGSLPPYPAWPMMGLLCAVGAFYGLVCSGIAVRRPLQYR